MRCSGLDNAISTAVLAGAGRAAEEKSGDRPSAQPRPLGAISSKQAGQSIAKASALGYAPRGTIVCAAAAQSPAPSFDYYHPLHRRMKITVVVNRVG